MKLKNLLYYFEETSEKNYVDYIVLYREFKQMIEIEGEETFIENLKQLKPEQK